MKSMKSWLSALVILGIFILGSILYTWPGPEAVLEGRTDLFMSDGTDLTTNAFQFDVMHRRYLEEPSLFFYGAFPDKSLNAPEGYVIWYAFNEKLAGLFLPFVVPVEQVSVLFAMILFVVNGISFYGMARAFGWNRFLALALSIAWAFTAYTRARAQVHASLVGVYAVPLAIWGLVILQKRAHKKDIPKAALCFLGCATVAHYYIIFLALCVPFWVLFYFSHPETRRHARSQTLALFAAVLPAALFLGLSFAKPVPHDFKKSVVHILPTTGKSSEWPHPFVSIYSANIEDYFSGDLAIGTNDVNPLRSSLTEDIRKNMRVGNFHEHALGIRWVLWLMFLWACGYALLRRHLFSVKKFEGALLFTFLLLGVFTFLTSLPPDWGFLWGPSAWMHKVVEQIRVPNRIGTFTYFSLLVIVGAVFHAWFLNSKMTVRLRNIVLGVVCLAIVLDFPPFLNAMPMAPVLPSRAALFSQKPGPCGMGFHFPFVSGNFEVLRYYYLLQTLRGTDCSVLNPHTTSDREIKMVQLYGYQNTQMLQKVIQNDPSVREHLGRFARCNKLDWIVFDPRVPGVFVRDFCSEWGGDLVSPDLCRSKSPVEKASQGLPDECLVKIQ